MQIELIASSTRLAEHKKNILKLFHDSFGKPLDEAVWDWAYQDNPLGEPYVALCYDNGELVGHYAMVAMPVGSPSASLNSYLSMTTMVAPTHRMHGLFVKLASEVYSQATNDGVDLVFGFPNEQSAPGFERKLQWQLGEPASVVSLDRATLIEKFDELFGGYEDRLSLDLYDPEVRQWRLSKPGMNYQWEDGVCYKRFSDAIDLVYFSGKDSLRNLPDNIGINVLIPSRSAGQNASAFDYRFGGKALAGEFEREEFALQLILSDVF